ncbi:YlxR family protein [Ruminococcus sp.]|uniref:RNase P modulator RnpM n=1 Tax=Ruminococcus sp. TaxID=41978 RepID=UPI0025FB07CE|nr:YlxR family protein [Ruminococcus sp.]MCI6615577.1 YlxR family protein [Ruminococcus sp.]
MKKVPLRKCTGCGEMKEKRELIRVVKAPEKKDENGNVISGGEISLDLTGRKPGRGAYVCKNADCFEKARKARRFERSLSCKIPEDVYEQMSAELENASED